MLGSLVYMSAIGWGVMAAALILAVALVARMVPQEERAWLDQPPAFIRPLWPLVRIVAHFGSSSLPVPWLDRIDRMLQKNGIAYSVTAEEFFAICVVCMLTLVGLAGLASASSGDLQWSLVLLVGLLGLALPIMWMKDARRKRDRDVVRTLPVFLEYLAMCVEAGLNFAGALKQAVDKGPDGAMKNEFRIVLRDISSGLTRADALRRMAERVDLKDLTVFVRAVIQAERMGSSMKETLLVQAGQRLDERFQRAEKAAMEAPVKLVIPLVLFIFPLTFIILLFPIVTKFIEKGTL